MALVGEKIAAAGYVIVNIDSIIVAQKPKMAPHIENMRLNIAKALALNVDCVDVKATTTEGLGFVGEGLGIASQSVVLIEEKA